MFDPQVNSSSGWSVGMDIVLKALVGMSGQENEGNNNFIYSTILDKTT